MTMQTIDAATRTRLRRHVAAVHWRRAIRDLGVTEGVIRRALTGKRIRLASVRAIRLALDLAGVEESRP